LAHGFRGFSLLLLGSIISGPEVRYSITAESLGWSRAAHLTVARKQSMKSCDYEKQCTYNVARVAFSGVQKPLHRSITI
jgi:hypothetical protein